MIADELMRTASSVLLTLAVNATLLLTVAWLVEWRWLRRQPARAELVWRGALLAALLSAAWVAVPSANGTADAARAVVPGPATQAVVQPARPDSSTAANTTQLRGTHSPHAPASLEAVPTSAAAESPRIAIALPAWLQRTLVLGWVAGAAASLLMLALAAWRLRRFAHACSPAPAAAREQARALAAAWDLPPVRVGVHGALHGPVALPARRLALPAWAVALPAPQLRAMLAHELWHLHRADPRWRLVHRLLLAPLFFHPLAWSALRRLDALAESACDAAAARLDGSGRALAQCLASSLSARASGRIPHPPRLAVAMSDRPGAVVRRVQHLLQETHPMNTALPSRRLRAASLALAVSAALVLPAIAVTARTASSTSNHVSVLRDDSGHERLTANVVRGDYRLNVHMDGAVRIADDERGIASLDDGASMLIEERRSGVLRRVLFTGHDGRVQRSFQVDGEDRPFDAAAQEWLARTLPEVFRATGIDAQARAGRLLARGGADALLAEIALIGSDSVRGRYLAVLLAQPSLDSAQLEQALELAGQMGSDFELRRTLAQALAVPSLDVARQRQLLELAADMGSDFERAELLIAASGRVATGAAHEAWRAALQRMGSDFEMRRVLESLLAQAPGPDTVALVLEAADGIASDFERGQLLARTAPQLDGDPALHRTWHGLAADMGSDFECRQSLVTLLDAEAPDADSSLRVLETAEGMGSGFETLQVLLALAEVMPAEPRVIARYRALARRLSDHERGQAERALDRFMVAL